MKREGKSSIPRIHVEYNPAESAPTGQLTRAQRIGNTDDDSMMDPMMELEGQQITLACCNTGMVGTGL